MSTLTDLVINNVVFTQKYFFLSITNLIMLGSDFLDPHFAMLNIGDCISTLHCADYMHTNSLSYDPVYDKCLMKIVVPATTGVSYKQFRKEVKKNSPAYIVIVQH